MRNYIPWLLVLILSVACSYLLFSREEIHATGLVTNQYFIEGLYSDLDLSNDKEVFRYVFSQFEDEVVVYPAENYFYFRFPMQGKVIWGSMALMTKDRDDGILQFGYSWRNENPNAQNHYPLVGGSGAYGANDSVFVEKIDDFAYSVSFEGKTVLFKLNDVGMTPPVNAKLREDEKFVGPIFDESGLKFFFVFNEKIQHVYDVLNEDGFVAESFRRVSDDVVVGERTGFAFYDDKENNRKILIGALGENVLNNNWYDGPFDQMPDNYIYTGQIPDYLSYIEANYPDLKGRLDEYGRYTDMEGIRVAVAPYRTYFSDGDLGFVEFCKASYQKPDFYWCITEQRYDVPPEKQYLLQQQ